MEANSIVEKISGWIKNKTLFSRKVERKSYYCITKKMLDGEFFQTAIRGIISRDAQVRDEFDKLVEDGKVFTLKTALERYPDLKNRYFVEKAAITGKFVRKCIGRTYIFIDCDKA